MQVVKVDDYNSLSKEASSFLLKVIKEEKSPVLGLATGSTPEGLYQELIDAFKKNEVSFQNVKTFNLDEYVGLTEGDKNSYRYYMKEKLFNHIDIEMKNVFIPNGQAQDLEKECEEFEEKLEKVGPIDVQVLGLGLNGHIGFNEPGTSFSSRTHIVELTPSTREANARFFNGMEEVPKQAITMGIQSIMQAKKILLLVSGESKMEALTKLMEGEVNENFPASVLKHHPDVTIISDLELSAWYHPKYV